MAGEARLWQSVKRALDHPKHDLHRVENSLMTGYPDVDYCLAGATGWLELKHRPEWPKRVDTLVRLPHYTDEQRRRLRERGQVGGRAYLLLQVGGTYLLFDWVAAQGVGYWPQEDLRIYARKVWENDINGSELAEELKRR